jgi:hypothetical protein
MNISILFAVLVLAAIAGTLARGRGLFASQRHVRRLSDDAVRQIETTGSLSVDEPLDLADIARQEGEFWDETWDEPEDPLL